MLNIIPWYFSPLIPPLPDTAPTLVIYGLHNAFHFNTQLA
jgi:hypothetical protein